MICTLNSNAIKMIAFFATLLLPVSVQADFTFFSDSTALQPEEIVTFNDPSLITMGTTVEGMTTLSASIVEFTSNDVPTDELIALPGMGGGGPGGMPNRVISQDGSFSSILIDAQDPNDFFTEIELNVAKVMGAPNSLITLTIIDQFGNSFVSDFSDDVLEPGPNFFSVVGTEGALIDRAILSASVANIRDIRQMRVAISSVPEPGCSALLLTAIGMSLYRRKR